jgi:hypothetical protein
MTTELTDPVEEVAEALVLSAAWTADVVVEPVALTPVVDTPI